MLLLFLFVTFCVIQKVTSCPFYIITGPSSTDNFTTFGPAILSAMDQQLVLWVCDQSVINETIPMINNSVVVSGDRPRGKTFSYLTILKPFDYVFVINVNQTLNPVIFENLNLVSTNTLFLINNSSKLILSNVQCSFSIVCVEVNASLPVSPLRLSLEVTQSFFQANSVGILHRNGYFSSESSVYFEILDVAILTLNDDVDNPYETYMTLYGNTFINVLFPLAYENLQSSNPFFEPPRLTQTYVDATRYVSGQTYIRTSNPNPPVSFGASNPGTTPTNGTVCPVCKDNLALAEQLAQTLAFVFFLLFLFVLTTTCARIFRRSRLEKSSIKK